jgi:hypothetical protein
MQMRGCVGAIECGGGIPIEHFSIVIFIVLSFSIDELTQKFD